MRAWGGRKTLFVFLTFSFFFFLFLFFLEPRLEVRLGYVLSGQFTRFLSKNFGHLFLFFFTLFYFGLLVLFGRGGSVGRVWALALTDGQKTPQRLR